MSPDNRKPEWNRPAPAMPDVHHEILMRLMRVESKLDHLINLLASELEVDPPALTLDGQPAGRERDQNEPL